MSEFFGICAITIVALSPLLRRLYIERFWIHARGTIISLDGGISQTEGTWVWTPIIEYHAAGQRFSGRFSYWQRVSTYNKSKYSVGDQVDILYNPRKPSRFISNGWKEHILITALLSSVIAAKLFPSHFAGR